MPGGISFNANSMQTNSIITNKIDHHSGPEVTYNKLLIAQANRSAITGRDSTDKAIKVTGMLDGNGNIDTMDTIEDDFKRMLVGVDKYLDIEHAGGIRRYIATPLPPKIDRPFGLDWADFEIDFLLSLPYGTDIASTSLAHVTAATSSLILIPLSIQGSAEYQYPVFTATLNSGTQLTNGTVTIGNTANGQVVHITRNWSPGDVIKVDPFYTMVTVNGIEVDFTGAPPIFGNQPGTLSYEDNFLTRNINYDVDYYRLWS